MNKDLLHVDGAYGKKNKWEINEELAKKQYLDDKRLEVIGELYRDKDRIERRMRYCFKEHQRIVNRPNYTGWKTRYELQLKDCFKEWKKLEFCLQALWRFELDASYHKDYLLPGCTCPKMDNDDDYPALRHVSGNCLLHGTPKP
jgi:hypothetical protein